MAVPDVECDGEWTRYFDRDDPSNKGDFETLEYLRQEYQNEICQSPSAVDARLIGIDVHHPISGVVATANEFEGFFCENELQPSGRCLDFEVRFCCRGKKFSDHTNFNLKITKLYCNFLIFSEKSCLKAEMQ